MNIKHDYHYLCIMMYWNPSSTTIEEWTPKVGWNAIFSEQDRIKATHLFFFLKNKKGYKDYIAERLVQMIMYKDIYPGLKYSDKQEELIRQSLTPMALTSNSA
jgi:hypothetical protein